MAVPTTTFCVSGAVLIKAGENADASITTDATLHNVEGPIETLIVQAEHYLNVISRYDYISNYGSLTTNAKKILEEAASNLAAIYVIQYNMAGYTSRIEAEDMINVLWARLKDIVEVLKDQNEVKFLT